MKRLVVQTVFLFVSFTFLQAFINRTEAQACPIIITQPQNQSGCIGSEVNISIGEANTQTYQWQWTRNHVTWENLVGYGAQTSTVHIDNVTEDWNNLTLRCLLNAPSCSTVISNSVRIEVDIVPEILDQSPDQQLCPGTESYFFVRYNTSHLPQIQWQVSEDDGNTWTNFSEGITSLANESRYNFTASSSMNGNKYRGVVSNACGVAYSQAMLLNVGNFPPTIDLQTENRTVCVGGETLFIVFANSSPVTYQWQMSVNSGATWTDITGANDRNYYFTNITSSMNGNQYRCRVANGCGSTYSNAAPLTVLDPPVITQQPVHQYACAGTIATFSITASGGTTIYYQWQISTNGGSSWSNITGAHQTEYTINSVTGSMNGNQYRCLMTNQYCTVTSHAATLRVFNPTVITQQPANQSICSGSPATFSVTAIGTTISYQWQISTNGGLTWSNITGAWQTDYTINSVLSYMNGNQYRCWVANECGSSYSNAGTLTEMDPPVITQQPRNQSTCNGSPATFSVTAIGTAITYQWQISTNGGSAWNDITGANQTDYTIPGTTSSMFGYKYRCILTEECGMSIFSNTATLTVFGAPVILTQPSNISVCPGQPASFSVTASGIELTYQWQLCTGGAYCNDWTNINGATSATYTIPNTSSSMNGYTYRCEINNNICDTTNISYAATLTISVAPTITTQPVSQIACGGNSVSFRTSATGTGTLDYVWFRSSDGHTWENTGTNNPTYTIPNVTSSMNGYEFLCTVAGQCGWVNSNKALLTLKSGPVITEQPASKAVCTGNPYSIGVIATGSNLNYQWQLSKDSGATWTNIAGATSVVYNSPVVNSTMNGYQYRCTISNGCNTVSGVAVLTVLPNVAPIVTAFGYPITGVCAGGSASFSVVATNAFPYGYQWQMSTNGGYTWTTINGATSATYTIASVTTSMNGFVYRCFANGCGGSTFAGSGNLMVINGLPQITTQPASKVAIAGNPVSFTVASVNDRGYQWQVSANGGTTWSNISGQLMATYSIANVTPAMNGNKYRSLVYGACGTATSNPATLTVIPGATISFMGNNNLYASSENGTMPMWCNRSVASTWETFTIVDAGGGKVALMNMNKYVSSENGNGPIYCNRTSIGDWEKFDWIVNADGTISLRGNNGKYVSSENGISPMTCNRATIGSWEKFNGSVVANGAARGGGTAYATPEPLQSKTESAGSIAVFPNPVTKTVNVSIPGLRGMANIKIFDMYGKVVMQRSSSQVNTQLDISAFGSGVYMIRVMNDGKGSTMKVVKD